MSSTLTNNTPQLPTFQQNVQAISGNRVVVEFGGVPVGLISSVRMSDDYGLEPAQGIGDIDVTEYVPSRATHRVSVTNLTLFASNLRTAGVAIENGTAALKGLVFDFNVYPKTASGANPGQPLRSYKSCSYGSGDVSVDAGRIVVQSGTFMALTVTGIGL